MPIDPRIAMGFQSPQFTSPVELANSMMQFKAQQRQNQLAEMQMRAAQREQERANALNQAYVQAYDPKTGQIDYNRLTGGLAQGGFGTAIPGALEEQSKGRKARSEAGEAEVKAFQAAMDEQRRQMHPGMTFEQFSELSKRTHQHPLIGPYLAKLGVTHEQSMADVSRDFQEGRGDQVIERSVLGAGELIKNAKRALEWVDIGGAKVGVRPDTGEEVARFAVTSSPNAPRTTIVNQAANEFRKSLGENAAKQLDTLATQAQSAQKMLATSDRLRPLVNSPDFISGTLGDARLAVAKALGLPGVEETQTYFAGIGEQVAERIKAFGAGTGLSDADRKFAEKIAGGSMELTAESIKRILDMNDKSARATIENYSERRKFLGQKNPDVMDFYPEMAAPAPTAAVEHLRANPNLRSQFDAKYGAGAAARALGE